MKDNRIYLLFTALIFTVSIFAGDAFAVNWQNDLDKALQDARSKGMPVMADFYTSWCGWCKKLDSDTYSNNDVNELSRKFVCVKVDGDKDQALARKYGVRGYPTVIFLDYDGKVIDTSVGYAGPDRFIKLMNDALSKAKKAPAGTGVQTAAPSSGFKFEGVITTKKGPAAIINGKTARVGDNVDGATVVEINQNQVKVRSNGKDIILEL